MQYVERYPPQGNRAPTIEAELRNMPAPLAPGKDPILAGYRKAEVTDEGGERASKRQRELTPKE